MYCPNCGQENTAEARYCETCGADLSKHTAPQTPTTPGPQTGPSVNLERKYAGFWLRFVAYIVDSVLLGIVGWIIVIPFIFLFADATYNTLVAITITGFVLYIIIQWLYNSLMEASSKQGTLGKMVLGIIVTDGAGNRISFGRATGRFFAKILSSYTFYIGYIMIAFTKKKQGLHDLLASTLVVKK